MKRKFEKKIIVITGAASGLGRELAFLFGSEGSQLILIDKNRVGLDEVKSQVSDCENICIDLKNSEDVDRVVEELRTKNNAIFGLINCAGYEVDGFIDDTPVQAFRENLQVNFWAPLQLTQGLIPLLKNEKNSFIASIASDMGRRAVAGRTSYCITKAALISLHEGLRTELSPYGIDVVTVFPGVMNTNFVDSIEYYGRINITNEDPRFRQHPKVVALRMIKGLKKRKLIISQFSKLKIFIFVNFLFPLFGDFVVKKFLRLEDSNL